MPTSPETLTRHRALHAASDVSKRVWFFHAHVYFEASEHARTFMALIATTFATPHLEVGTLVNEAIGPHPSPSFEVLFTRELFTDFVAWLSFHRPREMAILIHPLTDSLLADHTERGLWIGTPKVLLTDMLRRADEANGASGLTEERIIAGTLRH